MSLPVILVFVFFAFFTTQSLVSSFESHMHKSYFGVFGDLQLESESALLMAVYQAPELAHLNRSYRVSSKAVYLFQGEGRDVLKGVDVIAYDDAYLVSKFKQEDIVYVSNSSRLKKPKSDDSSASRLILSAVTYNQMGGLDNRINGIYNPQNQLRVSFDSLGVVDFGFLGNKPYIVMNIPALQALNTQDIVFNQVEFNGLKPADITKIDLVANRFLAQGLARDYQIINKKRLTQEARSVFETIDFLRHVLFFVLLSISIIIYYLAIKLLLNSKQSSLKVLEYLGISRFDIHMNLIGFLFVVFVFCLIVGEQFAVIFSEQINDIVGINL